jgi:hypothetical protein
VTDRKPTHAGIDPTTSYIGQRAAGDGFDNNHFRTLEGELVREEAKARAMSLGARHRSTRDWYSSRG